MRIKPTTQFLTTVAAAALLSSCASKTQITSQQESSRYLARAIGNYQPPGPSSDPWGPYVREAAAKYDVPERWIREVMHQESGGHLFGRGGDLITSGAGAMGLMQVMPATYDDLRARYRELGDDPYDPHNNILAGAAYIREMYDIYGAPGFLAAYNAGPGRLDDYLTRNRTLPEETRRYVAAIGPRIAGVEPRTPSPGEQYAMNAVPLDIPAGPRYPQFAAAAPSTPIVLNPPAPVLVAQAADPYIHLNPAGRELVPQPAWEPAPTPAQEPIHLNPPPAEPLQVAEASPADRFIHLNPVPAYEPEPQAPRPIAAPRPEPSHSLLAAASRAERLPEPPLPELSVTPPRLAPESRGTRFAHRYEGRPYFGGPASRPIEVAEFPEPPHVPRGSQQQFAASELVPLAPHTRLFGLVGQANATPVHHAAYAGSGSGTWAVQVGAFGNPNQASAATAAAREQAREMLGGARPLVAGVHQQAGTLYRARLTGLSHDAAAHACERLSHARTSCMIVSPEAQY